ncbi:peptide ABC transporter ATP-binding protein [Insulibacter thermoxylanivorax]|uniref:Peptide ABC transporter ATP-binding protein n=1 Tax=Insulibacter thermoxylanivorax TaxID=2749268 RepID=A0A916QDM8_9BACL|nr:ABC transporter ATP-binding protein [Insulibacter thermoxylanivorax]GFR38807.1 peptide ABC transporter ATP-binding protein [Insulibacter thermoxylanivorax]
MIQLKHVTKEYQIGDDVIKALDDITLDIQAGEFIAIMGVSGSGKSTLLNILGCMDRPSSGEYFLDGVSVNRLNDRELSRIRNRKVTFVFQHFALMEKYTAYENIELPLLQRRLSRSERRKTIIQAASQLGIEDQLSKLPKQMSGGQQQRAAIARALASGAEILLADEPTGALDRKTGETLMSIFHELNQQGKTIIIVTHDPMVAQYASRTIYLSDGRIDQYAV